MRMSEVSLLISQGHVDDAMWSNFQGPSKFRKGSRLPMSIRNETVDSIDVVKIAQLRAIVIPLYAMRCGKADRKFAGLFVVVVVVVVRKDLFVVVFEVMTFRQDVAVETQVCVG